MRYGLSVMNFGELADARVFAELARRAEAAGWDALLAWDHHAFLWGPPSGDPWTLLTAAALSTDRLVLGTDVAVLTRERPLPFANRLATIDRLAGGRIVLGVGLGGAEAEQRAAGEPVDLRERAALTDELLGVIRALLDGDRVDHEGPAAVVRGATLAPLPAGRVPVWIGGQGGPARRRASRWDGWIPYAVGEGGEPGMTPDELAGHVAEIREARSAAGLGDAPFDVGWHGVSPASDAAKAARIAAPWAAAGATWWLESPVMGMSAADLFARVDAGPPRT
ncbi:MAG TPA: LLM class flavin-dependent oxidoreductase [Candidatus Limnocylindrales bacterium]|nr:LLM class flavin-dependent oxidoreductase [Candidatus Limnocylindrales bacterium]